MSIYTNVIRARLSDEFAIGQAYMITRLILGISFLNAAIWKIFTLTPIGHVEKYFLSNFHDSWIPNILLWILGFSIPFFELIAGIAFCVGFRAREMAFLTGLLLIVTTYGHSLMNPLYNITQGLTFSRVVFVLVLLILPDRQDYISIDKLLLKLQVKQ